MQLNNHAELTNKKLIIIIQTMKYKSFQTEVLSMQLPVNLLDTGSVAMCIGVPQENFLLFEHKININNI